MAPGLYCVEQHSLWLVGTTRRPNLKASCAVRSDNNPPRLDRMSQTLEFVGTNFALYLRRRSPSSFFLLNHSFPTGQCFKRTLAAPEHGRDCKAGGTIMSRILFGERMQPPASPSQSCQSLFASAQFCTDGPDVIHYPVLIV